MKITITDKVFTSCPESCIQARRVECCAQNIPKARLFLVGFFAFSGIVQAADFSKLTVLQVCARVRHGNSDALQELVRRNAYPASEIAFIARGEIFVGMSEGGAVCALGAPETVNQTHTSSGTHIQAVYSEGRDIRYVYVDNGKVTAWQN